MGPYVLETVKMTIYLGFPVVMLYLCNSRSDKYRVLLNEKVDSVTPDDVPKNQAVYAAMVRDIRKSRDEKLFNELKSLPR